MITVIPGKYHEGVMFYLPSSETVALNDDGTTWTKIPNMTVVLNTGFTESGGTITKTVKKGKFSLNGTSDVSAGKPGTIYYGLFVNGILVDQSETPHTFNSANKIDNISITAVIEIDKDDTLEVMARGDVGASGQSITVETLHTTFWGV